MKNLKKCAEGAGSKHLKRGLALLLAVILCVSVAQITVFAEEGSPSESAGAAPESITVALKDTSCMIDGNYYPLEGEVMQLLAYDQDGNETPVTWSTTTSTITLNEETGEFTYNNTIGCGSTIFVYVTATSTIDESVSSDRTTIQLKGWRISNSEQTQALSSTGAATSKSFTCGVNGHNTWTWNEEELNGIAELDADPGTGTSIKFNVYRPGSFSVTCTVDGREDMTQTITVTVTGVAVEDSEGTFTKTYLPTTQDGIEAGTSTIQLKATCEEGHEAASWASGNEAVATVDEQGLVTARGIGKSLITVTDDAGKSGGIYVVVTSTEIPYFEDIQFTGLSGWTNGTSFSPTVFDYEDLKVTGYATSYLQLSANTLYNTDLYTAVATYTDVNGNDASVEVASGASTKLSDCLNFGDSTIQITIYEKENPENSTTYSFTVSRPRDTNQYLKGSQAAIVLAPEGRELSSTQYCNQPEGTVFRAEADGTVMTSTSVATTYYYYRVYLLENTRAFTVTFTSSTDYAHLRYSTDDGETWKELGQGSGTTDAIVIPDTDNEAKILLQVISDTNYFANTEDGLDGFEGNNGSPNTYTLWVESVDTTDSHAEMLSATSDIGDWYPEFPSEDHTYDIVIPYDADSAAIRYTVGEGNTAEVDGLEQTPDEEGVYTLIITMDDSSTNAYRTKNITVRSADGYVSETYSFSVWQKSNALVPDKVVDYLCINSQYTNAGYGLAPESTLSGVLKSLGNFGGYITYYYEDPIVDDPANPYGLDFFVYGNAGTDVSSATGCSFFEPGQVWVSADGEDWYALAGSDHYESDTLWDYTVTYQSTADGYTSWTDNYGNANDGTANRGAWPITSSYPLNQLVGGDTITLSGILLSAADGTITGDGSSDAHHVSWGYVDCGPNGTYGEAVNPYLDNSDHTLSTSGFDLAWAVDSEGNPVEIDEVHYIKVATASNIWNSTAGTLEKSTEISCVMRAQANESGASPDKASAAGATLTDGTDTVEVEFEDGQQVYSVDVGTMKYVSVTVNGTAEGDNIYVNNQRVSSGQAAEGFKVTSEAGETLIRILVQNGDGAPSIYLLRVTGSASAGEELINGISVNVGGVNTGVSTADGIHYTLQVGYKVSSVSIVPELVSSDAWYTVNGSEPLDSYDLDEGENTFVIEVSYGDLTETVILTIIREEVPEGSDAEITVTFTLYGDEKHGDDGTVHLYSDGAEDLLVWIPETSYTVTADTTVLELLIQALADYELDSVIGAGYVSSINGLGEFDNGINSGWLYLLNGYYGEVGAGAQTLRDGDAVVFHYTDDYTQEYTLSQDNESAAAEVMELIDAIGDVSLESIDAIYAARNAYEMLTAEQKAMVSNYDLLLAAETAYAALLEASELADIYASTGDYIYRTVTNPVVSSIGGEWAVIGLARAGYDVSDDYYGIYCSNLLETLIANDGVLSNTKDTEYAKAILALTAAGYDVTDVGGYNLLTDLSDFDQVVYQGINGAIWALIALDSYEYEIPEAAPGVTQTTREALIQYILDREIEGGGWALTGDEPDVDITAMVLQAFTPYYGADSTVTAAVDRGIDTLSRLQNDLGGFSSEGIGYSSESCAQVIVALTGLGINPAADERFIKNGNTVLDALASFYTEGGGFEHLLGMGTDQMATEQGYYALVSYYRYVSNMNRLYDMTDVVIKSSTSGDELGTGDVSGTGASEAVGGTSDSVTDHGSGADNTETAADSVSAATGDTSAPFALIIAMILCAAGIAVLAGTSGKRRRNI